MSFQLRLSPVQTRPLQNTPSVRQLNLPDGIHYVSYHILSTIITEYLSFSMLKIHRNKLKVTPDFFVIMHMSKFLRHSVSKLIKFNRVPISIYFNFLLFYCTFCYKYFYQKDNFHPILSFILNLVFVKYIPYKT